MFCVSPYLEEAIDHPGSQTSYHISLTLYNIRTAINDTSRILQAQRETGARYKTAAFSAPADDATRQTQSPEGTSGVSPVLEDTRQSSIQPTVCEYCMSGE